MAWTVVCNNQNSALQKLRPFRNSFRYKFQILQENFQVHL